MSVHLRVKNLERHLGPAGVARPCTTCGGEGWTACQLLADERDMKGPIRGQCPECGAVNGLVRVVLRPGPDDEPTMTRGCTSEPEGCSALLRATSKAPRAGTPCGATPRSLRRDAEHSRLHPDGVALGRS